MSKEYITQKMDNLNVISIKNQIRLKKGYKPYFSTMNDVKSVITDFDHFPYTRFYRGVYNSSDPTVIERESGWKPTRNLCYKGDTGFYKRLYPNHCFQAPCSTVFPCYPNDLNKDSDRDALNIQLNRDCIVQHR